MAEGRIIKALSGFYYVQAGESVFQCRGRGVFRNKKITPLVGDFVTFEPNEHNEGYITDIKQRENELVRPPIANINQAIILSSAKEPDFSTTLLDRFLVLIEAKGIRPVIFITKIDTVKGESSAKIEEFKKDYNNIGYEVEMVSSKYPEEIPELGHYFRDKVTVFAGQSGVGKSSLLNALNPSLTLKTGEISSSLGRGKHTTRHVELIEVHGGLVADTPGFSSLDFGEIELERLSACFPEMRELQDQCKFRGCLHHKEPKCAVKNAVEIGKVPLYRYEHYLRFFEEIKTRKPRY
ncbi:ribosome small subunit-dependent GTPase A [Virgibacillus halodenitrificans]|jgi:ribosome biogenesis GTPase / thiamine phosphate phosphatase|uniref:Small ribosomal subunit biogenesis GTPase RsgA n=1 Tax=Virgibacillus halodenitrificans TaxID=1482 RepID=A0AAC9J183_VIRHA|nr:ribosome small subunit-dependent GTPase A [Virgibacillus halodenitrificans]APC48678.1 ribosome small subunit-dependent GTPase A [Virgibacillus halodenitrificans]MBD1224476.1 ribosome small subunit-dependent GTPase A [Virgibacillus halodenitrificans]MEC2160251.1 ribosome small subunit-dependent GTPase A [Virgibacillus halodenitrificans]MYL45914.1 ribosome small subunit-dependent GTPase A [Virgibacillus halodenitrificans]MYL56409.1 ribosome small subunit-dependent GTPase A [Virgibacillus halo